jgi:16S rRNA (guanine527-N7)-methyltransferase
VVDLTLPENFSSQLESGVFALNIKLSDEQIQQLLKFLTLIKKWNATHNLTAVHSYEDMLAKHIFDSLSVASQLPKGSVIDVGTGAGLPGIPLAILKPEQSFYLLDASHKRVAFLREVRRQLQLHNVDIQHGRAEQQPPAKHAVVISRAFTSLVDFIEKTQQLIDENGVWLAMKGAAPSDELTRLNASNLARFGQNIKLDVPQLNAQRHLLIIHPL